MINIVNNQSNPDILVVSRTFFPKTGGIEEYIYNRCQENPSKIIVLTSGVEGDREAVRDLDPQQSFIVYRWFAPEWLFQGKFGSLFKQIVNMFWSLVLSLRLYTRYGYAALEWSHGYDFPSLLLLTYLLPVKFTVYLHGNDVLCPQRNWFLRSLFSLTLKRLDRIVCNSSFTKQYVEENFQFSTPIEIKNPVIRPEKFALSDKRGNLQQLAGQVREKYQIPLDAIVILTVGRLVRRKGCDRVIRCLPKILDEGIDVHYLICGKGEMQPELQNLAASLQVKERVHFAGFVPDEELAGYYSACDLFAMLTFLETNTRSIEGFGIVYLEAGYFGKPVLASRVGGVTDVVFHHQNGLLVEPDGEEEMQSALLKLCRDKALRERLGSQVSNR